MEKIFKDYQKGKKGKFINHPLVKLIKDEIPLVIEQISSNIGKYEIIGSAGKGNWTHCPRIYILDPRETKVVGSSYFVIYIFSEDTKRLYLSLNQGIPKHGSISQELHMENLKLSAQKYREKLGELPEEYEIGELNLGDPEFFKRFQVANICAKSYTLEDLPSEEKLVSDLEEILVLYNRLVIAHQGIHYFIKNMLENYSKSKTDINLAKKLNKEFANKGKFHNYLINIANQFGKGDYDVHGFFGSVKNLIPLPWIILYSKKSGSPFFIRFNFKEDMEGVYLSLTDSYQNVEKTMQKKGIIFDKFDEKHLEYIKKRVTDAKNKINQSTVLPANLIENIHLNSTNAKSAPAKEAANIYAKYYTLENLPSEDDLISDFEEIIRIYEILTGIDTDIQIKESLEIIFNKLPKAKKRDEKSKNHEVARAFLDIKDAISEIAKSTKPRKSYNSVAYYQSYGDWYRTPYIYVENQANKDLYGHWDQHYVGFLFPDNLDGVFLSLAQSKNYAEHLLNERGEYSEEKIESYLNKHANEIKEQLKNQVDIPDTLFEESASTIAFPGTIIYGKYYDKNNLPSNDQIISDFTELLNVHSQLKPDNGGNSVTFFKYLENKGYFFDQKLVENFLLSLKVKPFLILTGNSGTGKTKLAQLFAEYLNPKTKKNINNSLNTSILPLKRTITTYSKKHNGGWRFSSGKYQQIANKLHSEGITDFSKNVDLTINFNGRPLRGTGYIETKNVSYSPEKQSYVFYNEDNEIHKELSQISSGTVTIDFGKSNEIKESIKKHEIIPVGANWTENRHIIGFYNVITEKYQGTEALDLILSAIHNIEEPYFLILDEMNLSHVERYFSDFLSAMESEEEIELHQADEKDENDELPPKKIKLSENLMVIGTVNVDETTYMFSPKVLDRANTLEFSTLGAEKYMSDSPEYKVKGDLDYLQNPLSDVGLANEQNIRTENIYQLKNRLNGKKTGDNKDLWSELSLNIGKFQDILKKADFDFGFRTINEIIRFMCVAWKYEKQPPKWDNWERYFDAQIMQKMIPKLHGSQKELSKVLEKLEQECTKGNFPSSTKKIKRMRKTLKDKRYVSFTG